MKKKIKIGYVGLGRRGYIVLSRAIVKMGDVEITMLCDLIDDRLNEAAKCVTDMGRPAPILTKNYQDLLDNDELDAIMLFTGWDNRVRLAKQSMLAGKYTAIEVGCAANIEECFELVDIYEKTGVPLMMLENCCYGKRELMALNMKHMGAFGEIVHAAGGYCHYLNEMDLFKEMVQEGKDEVTHYRLAHYINENRENYPTHELGPISKCLGINRGNKMLTLSSFATKSCGLKQYATDKFGADSKYAQIDYKQGDIVNTIITCANGETILLTLDTTVPRAFYSRQFTIRGTKGMIYEDGKVVYTDDMPEDTRDNEADVFEKYGHPLNKEVVEFETDETRVQATFGLHADGVDWMVFRAFIESVKAGTQTPIDVYDSALWLAIGPLSAESIAKGGAPVEVPDFTRGKWQNREPLTRQKYCLDEVVVDNSIPMYGTLITKKES